MSVNNKSLGVFYLALAPCSVRWCKPHTLNIVETDRPFRRGKAIGLSIWPSRFLMVGLWRKDRRSIHPDYEEYRWIFTDEGCARTLAPSEPCCDYEESMDVQEGSTKEATSA